MLAKERSVLTVPFLSGQCASPTEDTPVGAALRKDTFAICSLRLDGLRSWIKRPP